MFGLWPSRLATTWAGYFSTTSHSKLARRFWKSRGQGWQPARRITFSNCGTEIRPSSPLGCHRHHERPCIGTVKSVVQLGAEFRDDRHHANSLFPPVVFRFRTPHHEPALLPVHIPPSQGSDFRRTPEPGQPAERYHKPPLNVRAGVQNCGDNAGRPFPHPHHDSKK